ncbi:MAG: hypothetical protein JSV03_15850 [Planctomycetota bacterium]|nr:MAG: hypothetical protein JSV03_15850 [Planctomycetota bacterium]
MLTQLDQENADLDLTSLVTVLTHTPSNSHALRCIAHIELGDGSKDLDGSGGDFELVVTIGGQTVQPSPETIAFSTDVQAVIQTRSFAVPAGAQVVVRIQSPNSADTDVDVTATLYDAGDTEMHMVKAALANKREHTIDTGVDVIKDDDGSTTLRTLTPSETNGVVTVTPS